MRRSTVTTMSGKCSKWLYRGFKQILKGRCKSRTWAGTGRYNGAWRTVNTTLRNRAGTIVVIVVGSNGRNRNALRTGSSTPHPRAHPTPPSKSSAVLLRLLLVMSLVLMLMRRRLLLLSTNGRRNISNPPHRFVNQEIRHQVGLLL